ncbi:transposable element Tcb1 transposase [Trichonephila clavipes]|nr:transposable element Tcb1 transposase [Trichonephila clavipes]
MDDNARPQRADIVDDYLESEGIARMAWAAYSPDLNPIENLWDALGRAVSSRFPPPSTLIELEPALQEEWRFLNSAVVDHLIESMTDDVFNGLLFKAVSTSAPFVFTMDALLCRFLSATDPVSRNRCTKSVIVDAFGAVSLFLLKCIYHTTIIFYSEIKFHDWLFFALGKTSCTSRCAQLTNILLRSKLLMMGPLLLSSDRNLNQPFWFISNKDYHVDVRDF